MSPEKARLRCIPCSQGCFIGVLPWAVSITPEADDCTHTVFWSRVHDTDCSEWTAAQGAVHWLCRAAGALLEPALFFCFEGLEGDRMPHAFLEGLDDILELGF